MAGQQTAESQNPPRRGSRWHSGYEEVVVAALLLVVTVYFRLTIENYITGRSGSFLAPSFWPGALLTIGIVLSAIYLVMAVIWARRGQEPVGAASAVAEAPASTTSSDSPVDQSSDQRDSPLKPVLGFVLVAGYIYLLAPIGFVPATVLFSVGFLVLTGERRWWVLVVFPVAAVTVLLGMFTQLLVVSLPRGTGIFVDLSTYLY